MSLGLRLGRKEHSNNRDSENRESTVRLSHTNDQESNLFLNLQLNESRNVKPDIVSTKV